MNMATCVVGRPRALVDSPALRGPSTARHRPGDVPGQSAERAAVFHRHRLGFLGRRRAAGGHRRARGAGRGHADGAVAARGRGRAQCRAVRLQCLPDRPRAGDIHGRRRRCSGSTSCSAGRCRWWSCSPWPTCSRPGACPCSPRPSCWSAWLLLLATNAFSGLDGGALPPVGVIVPIDPAAANPMRFGRLPAGPLHQHLAGFPQGSWPGRAAAAGRAGGELAARGGICARWVRWSALITAHALGAESELITAGLLGFNPVLTAIALGAVFYRPSLRVVLYTLVATVLSVIVQGAMIAAHDAVWHSDPDRRLRPGHLAVPAAGPEVRVSAP